MSDPHSEQVRLAYEQTSFEMVEATPKLEVPVSEAAKYRLDVTVDPAAFQNSLADHGYAFIAPNLELNYLSSKVYDAETNEFFHIKLSGDALRVYPKNENFSIETFARVVDSVETYICGLSLEVDDAD